MLYVQVVRKGGCLFSGFRVHIPERTESATGGGETVLDIYLLARGSSPGGVFTCYITFRTYTLSYWNYFPGGGGVLVLQILAKTGEVEMGEGGCFAGPSYPDKNPLKIIVCPTLTPNREARKITVLQYTSSNSNHSGATVALSHQLIIC